MSLYSFKKGSWKITNHSGCSAWWRYQQAERDLRRTFLHISALITTLKEERKTWWGDCAEINAASYLSLVWKSPGRMSVSDHRLFLNIFFSTCLLCFMAVIMQMIPFILPTLPTGLRYCILIEQHDTCFSSCTDKQNIFILNKVLRAFYYDILRLSYPCML